MPRSDTAGKDEEFQLPPRAISPLTGVEGSSNWGALNKFNSASRQVIADVEADELINWLPQLSAFEQVPGPSGIIGTLPGGTVIWNYTDILNGNLFTWFLSTNGHIYQMNVLGTFVDLGAGFATAANSCDIASWQGTNIIISDLVAQKIYNWNGSVLATVFTGQPEAFIAVYSNRLWMVNGLVVTFTNANTFNSLGGDSGSFIITDGRCANPCIGMRDFNGSLYFFGSNWIRTLYGLQDVGSPPVLTFSQQTLESQISIINKWAVIQYGGNLFFGNVNGFWQLSGATPTKISAPLDGFFQNLDTVNSTFFGAYGMILNMPCLLWQVRWLGDGNYTVLGYTINQQWFRVIPVTGTSTGVAKTICGSVSSAVTQNIPITYYTDGSNVYNLFGNPSAIVTSTFNTKIWDMGSKIAFDLFTNAAVQYVVFGAATITVGEVGSSGAIQGPAQPAGPLTYTYNPSVGQWLNNSSASGQWQNGPSIAQGPINTQQQVAGSSFKCAFAANVRAGSLLVALVNGPNTISVTGITDTLTQTWVQAASVSSVGGYYGSIWYFPNSLGGACTVTVTLSLSAIAAEVILYECAGMATVGPVDVFASNSGSPPPVGQSTSASVGLSTVNASDLVFAMCVAADVPTGTSGWQFGITKFTNGVEYLPVSSAGSYTASFTATSAWVTLATAFKTAGGFGVAGNWQGTVSQFYILQQSVVPFQDRNLGLNLTLTSAGAIMQGIVVSYRKTEVAKG